MQRSVVSPDLSVPPTAYRLQQSGIGWVFLDFLAQPAYMHINGANVARIVVAPDVKVLSYLG